MTLVLPETARPANLTLSRGSRARVLTSDLYDICNRVAEIDPSLYIIELDHDDPRPYRWIVMEHCKDGVDRMALRVREGELDARVLEKLRHQLAVPLRDRLEQLDREAEGYRKQYLEDEADRLYERIGPAFRKQLHDCGFTHAPRPTSFPTKAIRPS